MITQGMTVTVVRGVKVPRGTTGEAFWVGETKYGVRVGIKDAAGTTHWTAIANVVPAETVAAPAPVVDTDALADLEARMLALESAFAALATRLAAFEAAAVVAA